MELVRLGLVLNLEGPLLLTIGRWTLVPVVEAVWVAKMDIPPSLLRDERTTGDCHCHLWGKETHWDFRATVVTRSREGEACYDAHQEEGGESEQRKKQDKIARA